MVYVPHMASSLQSAIRHATETFPKYENDARWVSQFLKTFEDAGEDAVEKAFLLFDGLSKNKDLTRKQQDTVAKFAMALNFLRSNHRPLAPKVEKVIQKLLA